MRRVRRWLLHIVRKRLCLRMHSSISAWLSLLHFSLNLWGYYMLDLAAADASDLTVLRDGCEMVDKRAFLKVGHFPSSVRHLNSCLALLGIGYWDRVRTAVGKLHQFFIRLWPFINGARQFGGLTVHELFSIKDCLYSHWSLFLR